MSKDTPEVGDIYCDKMYSNFLFRLVDIIEYKSTRALVLFDGVKSFELSMTTLKRDYKYLGKSKANIQQLFEVQNDSSNIH